jgi:hypothetical protein
MAKSLESLVAKDLMVLLPSIESETQLVGKDYSSYRNLSCEECYDGGGCYSCNDGCYMT